MRVLIIGDSQAAGPPGQKLEAVLRAQGVPVMRVGYSSQGPYTWTQQHWTEYRNALASFQPTDVVLIFGTNEAASSRLQAALQQFRSSWSRVWYAGPPQYPTLPDQQAISTGVRQLASSVFGTRYLDAWPFTGVGVPRASDGEHFTLDGGLAWATGMLGELTARLNGTTSAPTWVGPAILAGAAGLLGLGVVLFRRRLR